MAVSKAGPRASAASLRSAITWAVALLALACNAAAAGASGQAPPARDFFRNPFIRDAKLSPDGQRLALAAFAADGHVRLYVADLTKPFKLDGVAAFSDADVGEFFWVNSRRLVYTREDLHSDQAIRIGGLWTSDWDGSNYAQLIATGSGPAATGTSRISRVLPGTHAFFSTLPGETDEIVVAQYILLPGVRYYKLDRVRLIRLNTRTRESRPLMQVEPPWTLEWVLDMNGEPRVAVTEHEDVRRVLYRAKDSSEWQALEEKKALDADVLVPWFIGPDDSLYATRFGGDTLYRMDPKAPDRPWDPFLTLKGFEFHGGGEVDREEHRLLGIHFQTDAHGTRWIEPRMAEAQKAVDAALPATINTITCGNCLSSRFFLVRAESDRQPARYFLFDPAAGKLTGGVGEARPWIDPKQMGQRDFFRYRARDGMEVPVYVTLPPGRKKNERVPLVVLVHGGPWVRGASWEWEAEAQFYATRGYAVVEPQFRGSTGFGYALFRAGWHQWGLAMQDDLADAARWAVDQGYADPDRIAIGGASYGGYATLMGLIKEPQLYRCGFELAGVTDIGLLYSIAWSDASAEALKYGMPALVADPEKDPKQIEETSPLKNAQRLKQPLLMAYGADDARVPMPHGTKFRDAVQQVNKSVEWIVYNGEVHGLRQEDHRIDYWSRVEALLDRCLKPSAGAPESAGDAATAASPAPR